MESHLNIFKTYTNVDRTHQLENDLTRALAITLQEDALFFHEVLKEIMQGTDQYNLLFESTESEPKVSIEIRQHAGDIANSEKIFAISLSESEMSNFWKQKHNNNFDPYCDLVIRINHVLFIIETKRNNIDCTSQLYNQLLNIIEYYDSEAAVFNKENYEKNVIPFDLNWTKLMAIAFRVASFQKSTRNENRFLNDFIAYIRLYNFRWLPEACIASFDKDNKDAISRRIELALEETSKKLDINKLHCKDRMGLEFNKPWANEILFYINADGSLCFCIYPGKTIVQGYSLFANNPSFNDTLTIKEVEYEVNYNYHIQFTSCQKFFKGLWFIEENLEKPLYTKENFHQFTGCKKRGEQWNEIEKLFDDCLNYDWRGQCNWNNSMINSSKNQFDISFGYEICVKIPFEKLKELDDKITDLANMIDLITDIYCALSEDLLIK